MPTLMVPYHRNLWLGNMMSDLRGQMLLFFYSQDIGIGFDNHQGRDPRLWSLIVQDISFNYLDRPSKLLRYVYISFDNLILREKICDVLFYTN